MTTATRTPPAGLGAPPTGRIRAAWAAAHAPAAGIPRWARIAACTVPLTVLPSSVWRIAACTFHAPIMRGDPGSDLGSSGLPGVPLELYVVLLSIVSELLARDLTDGLRNLGQAHNTTFFVVAMAAFLGVLGSGLLRGVLIGASDPRKAATPTIRPQDPPHCALRASALGSA